MKKLIAEEMNRLSADEMKIAIKIPVCIILDNVRSLLNVGSIFRTCDAFRVEKLYLCGITGYPPQREIQKTALGATETVYWEYAADAGALIPQLKMAGYTIIAVEQTDSSGMLNTYLPEPGKKYALILGNEVEGVSNDLLSHVDLALEIPQSGSKHSLNVSVAAGIVVYKFFEHLGFTI
jgi:tRNA G18 (ribose-2'-O)-methylase SpoU